jgi:hypothetical protein
MAKTFESILVLDLCIRPTAMRSVLVNHSSTQNLADITVGGAISTAKFDAKFSEELRSEMKAVGMDSSRYEQCREIFIATLRNHELLGGPFQKFLEEADDDYSGTPSHPGLKDQFRISQALQLLDNLFNA